MPINNNNLSLAIKSYISEESSMKLKYDISRIGIHESSNLQEAKFIIFQLFIQIGTQSESINTYKTPTLEYRNKNEIYLSIQPKIKNYIIFKNKENLEKYKKEELNENELYFIFEVENGNIKEKY